MRLIRRHGEAMLAHQRWKRGAVAIVAGLMMGAFVLSETYMHLDSHYGISRALSGVRAVPEASSTHVRRLFYPNDRVIGKWQAGGEVEDYDSGEYKNAPVARKLLIIVHIIGVAYMLVGLNTVCDIYFCGALDEMVEKWNVKPDVAGATFMAAGGSAPELFTSIIGAVGPPSDVGFGTIVGSAVFNVLAVIGCCGLVAEEPIKLTWWPLFRDCTYYVFGLGLLALFANGEVTDSPTGEKIGGGEIVLYEAIILFAAYLLYCTIMFFNERIEAWVKGLMPGGKGGSKVEPIEEGEVSDEKKEASQDKPEGPREASAGDPAPGPPAHHVGADAKPEDKTDGTKSGNLLTVEAAGNAPPSNHQPHLHDLSKLSAADLRRVHHHAHVAHHHHHHGDGTVGHHHHGKSVCQHGPEGGHEGRQGSKEEGSKEDKKDDAAGDAEKQPEEDEGSGDSDDDTLELVTMPEGTKDRIIWLLCSPIYFALYYGIARPTPKKFLFTFVQALLFIAAFSYWLVYCVEMFSSAILGGGNNVTVVMSFTLLAAGTSIPDLVSSMAVARIGEGDMAVSSSIGSNIFDILVGLPLPWILKIGIVEGAVNGNTDYRQKIGSPFIFWYVCLLLFMVAAVVISIMVNKWFLNKKLGFMMMALYVLFLCIVLPLELTNQPSAPEQSMALINSQMTTANAAGAANAASR